VYEGDFVNGKCHGKGKKTFANGDVYEGDWANAAMHGKGKYTWKKSGASKYVTFDNNNLVN
jgi:hypothetical protein